VEPLAVGRDPLAGQPGQQQVQGLAEAVLVAVQAGAEHLQVDPGAAPAHAQPEASPRQVVQQGRPLGDGDRVAVGEHAHRRADLDPAGPAEQVGGEGQRRGADPVADEVVLGQPDPVEAGRLGGHPGLQGTGQRLAGRPAGEPAGKQEHAELHRFTPAVLARRVRPFSSRGARATG
jgi:hypothetical protein